MAAAAGAWVALLVVAPYAPAWLGAVLYGAGSLMCHQMPDRSFHLAGYQLPVCARCLGLYAGGAVGAVAAAWTAGRGGSFQRLPRDRRRIRVVLAAAALPTALTWLAESVGLWHPSNLARALAGVPLGAAVGLVVSAALAPARRSPALHYGECAPPQPNAPRPPRPSI